MNSLAQLMGAPVKSAQAGSGCSSRSLRTASVGKLDRRTQQLSQTQELTQKSLNIARQLQAEDMIAQSAWQVGGISCIKNRPLPRNNLPLIMKRSKL